MTVDQWETRMAELGERVICAELAEMVFPSETIRRRFERAWWARWFERNGPRKRNYRNY